MPTDYPVSTQRFEDYIRAHAREHELYSETLRAAKAAVDIRLESMNELREQINSERGRYETKDAADMARLRTDERGQRFQERMNIMEQDITAMKGRHEGSRTATIMWIAGVGVFFTLVQILLKFGLPN